MSETVPDPPRRIRFGYMPETNFGHLQMQAAPGPEHARAGLAQVVEEAQLVEECGFDGVFLPGRHMRYETVGPDPLTLLAALATATQRVDLGTYMLVPSLYEPMSLAERTAVVDNLSGGRLILGVSLGYNEHYFKMFSVRFRQRLGRLLETVEILKQAWTSTEPFTFEGRYYQYRDVFLSPLPYQRDPHPPIWGGASRPAGARRAGTYASALGVGNTVHDLEVWNEQVDLFLEAAHQSGVAEPQLAMLRNGFCAPTRDEAVALLGERYMDEFRYGFERGLRHPAITERSQVTSDQLGPAMVIGSPDDCAEQVQRLRDDFCVDYLLFRFRLTSGPDRESVQRAIRLFGEEVIPRFR